jgi:hypothetical protein
MLNTIVGAGAVRAGAASRYGSGSNQKMRLLAAPAPQHWLKKRKEISIFSVESCSYREAIQTHTFKDDLDSLLSIDSS